MDQSIGLHRNGTRAAPSSASASSSPPRSTPRRASEAPFFHLEFDQRFSATTSTRDADADAGRRRLPADAGPQPKDTTLADGTQTRVKIDLFPEYIRHLPPEKRAVWDVVGRALCSEPVKEAFMRRLAPGLASRFGAGYAKVGMYPIPILTRDIPGYRITPHTDTRWKGITVQLYLPRDDATTHIGTIFHDRLPDGSLPKHTQMKFAPNSGYAFAVGDNTWHSADPVGPEVTDARLDPADLFRRCRACCDSCAIAASGSAISSLNELRIAARTRADRRRCR